MAKNIGSIEQAAAAEQATKKMVGHDIYKGFNKDSQKFANNQKFSRFEREALQMPIDAVYIYNISPIFKWQKDFAGLGTLTLFPRKSDQKVSDPVVISDRMVRAYDGGNRVQKKMIETPLEIVEDFLACSTDYPGRPENNLTSWGAFFTVGKSLEEMDPREAQVIIDEAELKHQNKCEQKVAEADALSRSPNLNGCVVEMHRKCALYLGLKRDWVASRDKLNATEECVWCGFDNKRGVVKCRNCHEVLDPTKYKEMSEARDVKK